MRITLNPILDIETLTFVGHDGCYEYTGPIWRCKGDPTAQAAETSQANFDNQLTSLFTAQYGKQSAITNYLTNQLEPNISKGGQGESPAALTAARTGATDTISSQYQNAQRAAGAVAAEHGGDALPSGVNAQVAGSIAAGEAGAQSEAQNTITAQNEALKQQNYWNSVGALSGNASLENPLGYAGAASGGSNAVSGLSQAETAAQGPTLGAIIGSVAGGAGSALGGYLARR
jgi:hypothetical protein